MQKLKEFFNAVKPDALLLKDMTPGVTTEAQIRDQMGKPETERTFTDGSKRFEYPRGPQGLNTYMVDIDRDGKLQAITQVLTAANFAKIRMGMSEDEVRRLLGKPGADRGVSAQAGNRVELEVARGRRDRRRHFQRAFRPVSEGVHDIALGRDPRAIEVRRQKRGRR